MGGYPQPHPGAGDGGGVGPVQILLPQMDEIGALIQHRLPVVVDHKLRAVPGTDRQRRRDLRGNVARITLEAQLHQSHPHGDQLGDHRGIGKHRVKARQDYASSPNPNPPNPRSAMPNTGVEGSAMSRGGISPAS